MNSFVILKIVIAWKPLIQFSLDSTNLCTTLGRIVRSLLYTLINELHQSTNFEKHFASTLCKLKQNKLKISKYISHLKYIKKKHVFCILNYLNFKSILYFILWLLKLMHFVSKLFFDAFCSTLTTIQLQSFGAFCSSDNVVAVLSIL